MEEGTLEGTYWRDLHPSARKQAADTCDLREHQGGVESAISKFEIRQN
jgi:hypothetical protein